MKDRLERTHATFPDTNWRLIEALRSADENVRQELADYLIETYWPPVYAWLRKRQYSGPEAAELAQAFFCEIVLHRDTFLQADEERGRLRRLLCKALENFVKDRGRTAARRNRLFGNYWDTKNLEKWLSNDQTASASKAFDQQWALSVLEQAIRVCQEYYEGKNQAYWKAFELRVLIPSRYGSEPVPQSEVARLCGFKNESHVDVAVHYVKKRVRATMKLVIHQTVDNPMDASDELEQLRLLLQ